VSRREPNRHRGIGGLVLRRLGRCAGRLSACGYWRATAGTLPGSGSHKRRHLGGAGARPPRGRLLRVRSSEDRGGSGHRRTHGSRRKQIEELPGLSGRSGGVGGRLTAPTGTASGRRFSRAGWVGTAGVAPQPGTFGSGMTSSPSPSGKVTWKVPSSRSPARAARAARSGSSSTGQPGAATASASAGASQPSRSTSRASDRSLNG